MGRTEATVAGATLTFSTQRGYGTMRMEARGIDKSTEERNRMYKLYAGGAFVQGFKSRDDALIHAIENDLVNQEFEILDGSDE